MEFEEPVRWLGLVGAGGVLLPFVVWLVVAEFDDVWRRVAAATSATLLLFAAGLGAIRIQSIGLLLTLGDTFGNDDGTAYGLRVHEAWIGVGALVAALLVAALLLRAGDDAAGYESLDDDEDDDLDDLDDHDDLDDLPDDDEPEEEDPAPPAGVAETLEHGGDEGVGSWVAAMVDRAPPTRSPATAAILALLVLTAALAAPLFGPEQVRSSFTTSYLLAGRSDHTVVLTVLADGLLLGTPLMLAALALRRRHVVVVALAFAVLAGVRGWSEAWPSAITSPLVGAIALGLSVGLLVPVTIRLLAGVRRHAVTNVVGVAVGLALVVSSTYVAGLAVRTAYEERINRFRQIP